MKLAPSFALSPFIPTSALAIALFLAPEARAADGAESCITAHASGQEQRKNSALLSARASFVMCAAAACPDVIRSDCAAFLQEVDAALPSVLLAVPPSVTNAGSVSVRIDSAPELLPLDRNPLPLDPGEHQFVFVLSDGRTDTQTLTLREGEKSRRVEARFLPPRTPEDRGTSFRVPVLSYVFGGAALLASGSFVYFALQGRSHESDLDRCAPRCDRAAWSDERDSMRTNYLIADVSLGVAIASLGLGTYFLIDGQSSGAASPEGDATLGVSGGVEPGGFRVQAAGRF